MTNQKTIHEMQIIFNINMMRKSISGKEMDLDNLEKYDVYTMTYDELFDLQISLIKPYNESLKKKNKVCGYPKKSTL